MYAKTWWIGLLLYGLGAVAIFLFEEPHPLNTAGFVAILAGFAVLMIATHLKQAHIEDLFARLNATEQLRLIPRPSSSTVLPD